ncbi:hypothetical protein JOB18_038307 [Solea senegalensis]|uniref:Uncharacterized protein n=1 Tax=Solea senegalensis TaxID=28829 RepID=A0AAV6PM87_SOLSE|nr:hypothetical protein JOB18_038307 [Solea senegalensis]
MAVTENQCLDAPEMQARLFIGNTIFYVLQRTGVLQRLSRQENILHIRRLMNHTTKGLSFVKGHLPDLSESRQLSNDVVQELQRDYGDKVKDMLLDTDPVVEAAVVLCLYRNIKVLFEEKEQTYMSSCFRCLAFSTIPYLVLLSIGLFFTAKYFLYD